MCNQYFFFSMKFFMATYSLTLIDRHFIPGLSATINCPQSKHCNREACQDNANFKIQHNVSWIISNAQNKQAD